MLAAFIILVSSLVSSTAMAAAVPLNLHAFTVPCKSCARRDVPYYASASLMEPSDLVTSAVFSIHGIGRDATNAFSLLQDIAAQSGADGPDRVLIAPHFQARTDDPSKTNLFWSGGGWLDGSDSIGKSSNISSFSVIDSMLVQAAVSYPNLTNITLVGFSAGGQTVHRYAAFSSQPDTLLAKKITTRFVVANPGSYIYPTPARATPSALKKACVGTPQQCYATLTAADFTDKYALHDKVPNYDDYKYGLSRRTDYPLTQGGSRDLVLSRIANRDIRYIVGDQDTKPNFQLDTSEEANAQGPNRSMRAAIYVRYLREVAGVTGARLQFVEGCGHSSACVLSTKVAREAVFGV
ncbi:hypothetical protein HKX48_009051 [Thoreauomyces humboldtii]|nr:hypothetical protein HKX48_009051 [Thoreauomyces humboldtii]